jgi:hypothetical protein
MSQPVLDVASAAKTFSAALEKITEVNKEEIFG